MFSILTIVIWVINKNSLHQNNTWTFPFPPLSMGKSSSCKQLGLTHHRPKVDPYSANAMQSRPSAGPVPTPLQTQPRPPNSMARPVAANGVPLPAGSVTQMEMQQGGGGKGGGWKRVFFPPTPNNENEMSPLKRDHYKRKVYIVFQPSCFSGKVVTFLGEVKAWRSEVRVGMIWKLKEICWNKRCREISTQECITDSNWFKFQSWNHAANSRLVCFL